MEEIKFTKIVGSGNDFIIIDSRNGEFRIKDLKSFIKNICSRRFSIGADGVILIENSRRADFKWRFFNADASEAEMCGNGGRCAARYAFINKISGKNLSFETIAGLVKAEVKGERIKLQLPEPNRIKLGIKLRIFGKERELNFINTGVPHIVYFVGDIENSQVEELGREIRFHKEFAPRGTNVNFVKYSKANCLKIRTYERGVEGETLACGTGAVASAIIASCLGKVKPPVKVIPRSGESLKIYFDKREKDFHNVFLEGEARFVYEGVMKEEAWKY